MIPNIEFETKIINFGGETDTEKFEDVLKQAIINNDSVGGIVRVIAKNVETGLGEPYFDSIESIVSHLLFSVGGRCIEEIGTYNPLTNPATLTVDAEKAQTWIKNGAQPTDTVRSLLKNAGVL